MIDPTDAHDQPAQVFKMKITIRYTGQRIDVVHVDREMVGAVLGCKM